MVPSIALIEPQIPPNTGNVGRLCAALGAALHLIEPLGFQLSDPRLRRAGLGYWDDLDLWVHPSLEAFRAAISPDRCLYFSARGSRNHFDAPYTSTSVLVFGSEAKGMPRELLQDNDRVFRVPMVAGVRNINLATSVGVVAYESIRQLGVDLESGLRAGKQ
ncbi:MAG: tRNA (cytidine(34)-2'-O)-methyltransferase [Gemmatimonadales bacterium]